MEKIIIIYLAMAANEAHFLRLLPQHGAFSLWCGKGEVFCEHPFAFHL